MAKNRYTRYVRDVLRYAKELGYEDLGCGRSGHMKVRHTVTGKSVTFSVSPSHPNAEKMARRDLERCAK
jgi:hypothetical protein